MTPTISPLESATDSESDSPPFLELDTDSVVSQSPSESAYDADSKSEVPCMVPILPNVGGRPHYHHGPQLTTQLTG